MLINYTCPHCNNALQINDKYAGIAGKCNRCGANITVPSSLSSEAKPKSSIDIPNSTFLGKGRTRLILIPILGVCLLIGIAIVLGRPNEIPYEVTTKISSKTPSLADQNVYVVDIHSHTSETEFLKDDGNEPVPAQSARYLKFGYQTIFHTPHSDYTTDPARWQSEHDYEENGNWGLSRYLGEEVRVEPGPKWQVVNGLKNNDHLGVIGQNAFIADSLPFKAVCERAHTSGGLVSLNHPGPAPAMWEAGYWTQPAIHDKLDAIEVFNGQLMHFLPVDSLGTYFMAVNYGKWGLKVAAVGGTDSHKSEDDPQVATLVVAPDGSERSIVEAIRRRNTYAVFKLLDLRMYCAQLGQTIYSGDVNLKIETSRPVEKIELVREGRRAQLWENASSAEFTGTITENTTYLWRIFDGDGRAYSSAIWYEPNPIQLPDLVIDTEGAKRRGKTLSLAVRNDGRATAKDVVVEAWAGYAGEGGELLASRSYPEIPAGNRLPIKLILKSEPTGPVFVRVDPESYTLQDDDAIAELNERNNSAIIGE